LFMTTHAEGHALDEIRLLMTDAVIPYALDCIVNGKYIISINLHSIHAVTLCLVNETNTTVLLRSGSAQSVSVIFYYEDYRQVPYRRHIQRLMKISFTRSSGTRKCKRNLLLLAQLMR